MTPITTYLKIEHYSGHPEVLRAAQILLEKYYADSIRRNNESQMLRDAKKLIASLWVRDADMFRFTTKTQYFNGKGRKQVWMTNRTLKLFNKMLVLDWVVLVQKGRSPQITKTGKGMGSVYCRTQLFKDLLSSLAVLDIIVNPDLPRVELRNDDDCLVHLPESYQNSQIYSDTVKVLEDHYQLLLRSKICLKQGNPMPQSMYYYVRKFKRETTNGGRFYAGIQQLPKAERLGITINEERVGSLDINQLHPTLLLRGMHGVATESEGGLFSGLSDGLLFPSPEEVYAMPDYPDLPRVVHKILINALFNAKTVDSALRLMMTARYWHSVEEDGGWHCTTYSSNKKLTGWKVFPDEPKKSAQKYLESFCYHHPLLVDAICKGYGGRLQYLDSKVIEKVLLLATEFNIPVLPVHDEIILPISKKEHGLLLLEKAFPFAIGNLANYGHIKVKWQTQEESNIIQIPLSPI